MTTVNDLKRALKSLENKPKFERQLEFAALLTDYFKKKGIKPIVVGGLSVEIYTRNDYHTHDIDFVSDGWHLFDHLLTQNLGFTRTERAWYHLDTEIAVEIPSNYLEGNEDRVYEIILPDGKNIYVIGVEDIIIHRLEGVAFSVQFPEEDEDYEWAYRMFLIHKEDMDIDYLIEQAKQKNIYYLIEKWWQETN
ncbi:hypothetical protein AAV35_000630 [Salimicrobium jeotgali]|uniref:DUF6036 domain-containing protein n=1 Tax=Salimicrobium jeotgali TaxID=1230341 RepID=K2FI51_9BACI|nr:DUF6036 family nucleotidyltransferase [Salimicrobium jeotgali]AKG03429.1 hypothetical protein AAV35_000630 [Salimicrobium jeotgali]EKE30736.1 hypothetical protein MJ3_12240 [Salimicrobium jeotgali]MBM7697134.1 hypothetical protein [Salimicrobium jeotgali]